MLINELILSSVKGKHEILILRFIILNQNIRRVLLHNPQAFLRYLIRIICDFISVIQHLVKLIAYLNIYQVVIVVLVVILGFKIFFRKNLEAWWVVQESWDIVNLEIGLLRVAFLRVVKSHFIIGPSRGVHSSKIWRRVIVFCFHV